ncbi:MAG: hypothetical protein JKY53_13260 [Flavobacteriales bacterium]|nr:hypothetical protein [Flavobacteriales bacterium]
METENSNPNNIEIIANKDTNTIYVSWDEFALPPLGIGETIEYTVSLYKNELKEATKFAESNLEVLFEDIDLSGTNDFKVRVEGNIYLHEGTIPCGIQELKVTIIDGVSLMVTGVNASFTDGGDLSVSWDQIDLDAVSYTLKLVGQFINDNQASLTDTETKYFQDIENNCVTLTLEDTGIAAGDPNEGDDDDGKGLAYEIYITPHYIEKDGTESDVFTLITSQEEYEESSNPEFNIHALKAGDPVNVSTGTLSYDNVDLEVGDSKHGLKFQSFYHSQYNKNSMFYDYKKKEELENHPDLVLGTAWSHNYMISLAYKDKKVTVYFPDNGAEIFKQKNKKSKELKIKGKYNGCKLFYINNSDEAESRYRYVKKDQTEYIFNNDGLLLEIISPIKNRITLMYDENNLLQLVDAENLPYQLKFTYTDKKITEVIGVSDTIEQNIKYTYKSENLATYTDILGNSRKFDYYSGDKNALMKTAEDQNGTTFVYNKYDATINHYAINKSGYQVVFQQDADEYARDKEGSNNGLAFKYNETHGNLWPWNWSKIFRPTFTCEVKRQWKYEVEGIEISGSTKTVSTANKRGALGKEVITVSGSEKTNKYSYDGFNNCIHEHGDTINETYKLYDSEQNLTYECENEISPKSKPKKFINKYKYNGKNQLKAHTDKFGNTTEYTYKNDNLIKVQYPLKQIEKYKYLDLPVKGLMCTYTDQMGNITLYSYNSPSTKIYDPNITQITNQNETVTKLTYEDQNCPWLPTKVSVFNQSDKARIKTSYYEYNNMGVKIAESIAYNNQTSVQAFSTQYGLDNLNQVTSLTDAGENTTEFTYSPNMQRIKIKYPAVDGIIIEQKTFYDAENNMILESVGDNITQYAYNSLNQLTKKIDPNGNIYKYTDRRKDNYQTTNVIYPELEIGVEVSTTRVVDRFDRPVKITTRMGQTIEFKYTNNSGKLTTTTEYLKKNNVDVETTTAQIQDQLGRIIESIDQEGNSTISDYKIEKSDKEYVSVTTTTNPLGVKSITKTNAIEATTYSKTGQEELTYKYDGLNRIVEATQKLDATKNLISSYGYGYDVVSNTMQTKLSQNGEKISTSFNNGVGQLVLEQNVQNTTSRNFNSRGQLEKYAMLGTELALTTDSNQITYAYDDTGLNNKTSFSDGSYVSKRFDNNGNNIETQQHLIDPTEISSEIKEFDAWNRVKLVTKTQVNKHINTLIGSELSDNNMLTKLASHSTVEAVSVVQEYDQKQHLKGATDWKEGVATLDDRNPVARQEENSISNVIAYEYNNDNMLTKLVYPSAREAVAVSYEYDHMQRMKSVTDWKNRVTTYEYTPTGNVKNTIFSNGVTCKNSYDAAQNLQMIKTAKDGTLISLYNATKINDNGYPLEVTELQTIRPKEDKSKNTLTYNLANQLETFDGGTKIAYDVNGNPTALPNLDGTISYNDMNLITRYGDDEYQYDAFGLRSQSKINGVTKNYLISSNDYSGPYLSLLDPLMGPELMQASSMPAISTNSPLDQLLQTSDENDHLQKRFIYGHGLIAEESESGAYSIYHYDAQGSTIALTNEDGIVTDKYAYSPYGEILAHEGNNDTGFLYNASAGVYTDSNGLSNMRSRSYRADLMRFVQQDFLLGDEHNPMSLNRYAFVGGIRLSSSILLVWKEIIKGDGMNIHLLLSRRYLWAYS